MSTISERILDRASTELGRTLGVAVLAVAVAFGLHAARVWESLDRLAFDIFTVTSPAPVDGPSPVVVVGIDEPSFSEIGKQWPWQRDLHARLVDRLTRAGVSAIVFDIVFSEPSDPAADAEFARAIRESGRVVLAGDVVFQETGNFRGLQRVEPLRIFRKAGARTGISSIEVAGDQVVRHFPRDPESLWRAALDLHRKVTGRGGLPASSPGANAMLRYSGGADIAYASYYQALDPEGFLPEGLFRGRIALVGLNLKTSPDPMQRGADTYATPFMRFSKLYASGVEVQAQFIASADAGTAIVPAAPGWVLLLAACALAASVVTMRRWRAGRCTLFVVAMAIALAALSFALFDRGRAWLPVSLPIGIALAMYAGRGTTAYVDEIRQRLAIRRAFEFYVAPTVVSQMTLHPERLVLGGERKELTVMFTDLAGFTTIAEGIAPEEVARILNEHLTRMARVVLDHGGTIDKFIGDSVMAFWGAPLDDPAHARHGVEAAIGMQVEMERWRREAGETIPEAIAMRVGLNTGPVVVGNLGSRLRFDYTVIGDAVNLASRLESVNRLYGTGILLSESTANAMGDAIRLRHVDRIRVKGKRDAIEVFTPAGDVDLAGEDEEAIRAYRAADWDRSESLWRNVLGRAPCDAIARVYLERIATNRRDGVSGDWDGSHTLDSK